MRADLTSSTNSTASALHELESDPSDLDATAEQNLPALLVDGKD